MNPIAAKSAVDAPLPDFENNVSEFESDFLDFVNDTDAKFDFNLLRYPLTQQPPEPTPLRFDDSIYPKTKKELNQLFKVETGKNIAGDVWGNQVVIEDNASIDGSLYSVKDMVLGENCSIGGSIVAGGRLEIRSNCQIGGTVVAAEIVLHGNIRADGTIYSRGDLLSRGSLEAQELLAGGNIQLTGQDNDEVTVEAATIFAQNGEIEINIPVKLGLSRRTANIQLQKFYLSRAGDGTFRLARTVTTASGGARAGQGALITNLSDAELEKLLADLATVEQ
jgi:predicted acyltransferase (DUF342 family)